MKFRRVSTSGLSHAVTVRVLRRNGSHQALLLPPDPLGGNPGKVGSGAAPSADGETFPVPEALSRAAAMMSTRTGVVEIVVELSGGAKWNPAWGELI
jgi:hypothetical protein